MENYMKNYEDFLRSCKLVEDEQLPQYEVEITWNNNDIKPSFKKRKTAKMTQNGSFQDFDIRKGKAPFMDVTWSVELELLPVIDDGTMSAKFHIPLEKSLALASYNLPNLIKSLPAGSSSDGSTSTRFKNIRDGISRRISGGRANESARSLKDTLQRNPDNPDCVLLAVVKWEGLSACGFTVIAANIQIGRYSLTSSEPLAAIMLSDNSFVLESSSSLQWASGANQRRDMNSIKPFQQWLIDDYHTSVLSLTIQLNEMSIPRIGFPFSIFSTADRVGFDETIAAIRTEIPAEGSNVSVLVQGSDGQTYCLLKEDLSQSSAYFRTFLTENWEHSAGDGKAINFPLVSPFTILPDLIPLIVYFIARKTLLFGLSENAADLIIAADVLQMPGLMRLAEIAAIGNITQDNVTQLIRLAWQFQANILFRAALIFLRTNYDEIWIKNRGDLADLGRILSNNRFMPAFKMESSKSL